MPPKPVVSPVSSACTAYVQAPGGWFLNNAGWVVGEDRTLLIDTCATEERSRRLIAAAHRADRSGAPLLTALTHAHGDHAHGAGLVARDGGTLLATRAATDEILAGPNTYPSLFTCSDWGDIAPPQHLTPVSDPLDVDLGGTTAEIVPVPGTAHTDGDLIVWVPDDGALFTGDLLFSGVTPLAISGSVQGWLYALEWLAEFGATCLIPGHGPISTDPADLIGAVRGYLEWLLTVTSEPAPDFDTLEQRARSQFAGWLDAERHAVNLRVAHGEQFGQPCELDTALAAMRRSAGRSIDLDLQL